MMEVIFYQRKIPLTCFMLSETFTNQIDVLFFSSF